MDIKKKRPRDINELAAMIVGEATDEDRTPGTDSKDDLGETPEKNPNAVALGRLGGLKGGAARAKNLSPNERSRIARIAASARWNKHQNGLKGRISMEWRKELTKSDAQQETQGAKMPFLRFTKEDNSYDHTTWFRNTFFANETWTLTTAKNGRPIEEATINVHVILCGNDLGVRKMRLDHDPNRSTNHNAPTTHLHYDNKTRQALESMDLSGHTVVVKAKEAKYLLEVL